MNAANQADDGGRFEYPDQAGYPDGSGLLDEGQAALVDEVTADALDAVDSPSAEAEAEIAVRRLADEGLFSATIGDREVANLRFVEEDGRVVVLTTTVLPEFRGRGIASALIAVSLDDLRGRGVPLTVRCPVVAAFIASNSQYQDLAGPAAAHS
ncbi:GNAT family N-acetyltransferase [Agromyces silvae]|uniref:GNAT family N-acetyltransferase n=1 Tax=Agromyces silvae TaxID=3388266 RepID=UPI00280B1844|nr:GNAT family N-acetyltransferase [Agromyces protaetiae]